MKIKLSRNPLHVALAYGKLLTALKDVPEQELSDTARNCEAMAHSIVERGICLIAESDDGELVGATFALFDPPGLDFNFKRALGCGTWVRPESRRQGVATALHEKLCAGLKKLGCERLVGAVHRSNKASLTSVKERGFEVTAIVVTKTL